MNISPFALSVVILGLVLFGISDLWDDPVVEAPPPQTYDDTRAGARLKFKEMTPEERERSTCYALVPRHETYSVVLNQGVTCITVIGVTR